MIKMEANKKKEEEEELVSGGGQRKDKNVSEKRRGEKRMCRRTLRRDTLKIQVSLHTRAP